MTTMKEYALTGALGLAALLPMGSCTYSRFMPDKVETEIVDVQTKRYDGRDKYLVFTKDSVLENTDAWYRLKFNSSDVQNKALQLKGKKAKIEKYGWRMPFFSQYENIVGIEEAKE